jgi:hypothetical protein
MKIRARVGAVLTATLLGVVGAAALASPASAATYGPYQLTHQSFFCMEAPTSNLGQQVILNYCGGPASHNQHINFEDSGTGAYQYFLHVEGSAYCLVPGNADLYNSTIVLWTCDYSSSRFIWYLGFPRETNLNARSLQNIYNALCMDSKTSTAGVYVRMNFCSGESYWYLTPKS